MRTVRPDLIRATWRKSSHSVDSHDCVEVADEFPGTVPVRDSKTPHGPVITFRTTAWATFIATVTAPHSSPTA
ncbi:DUF397 domain-containing protein [Streptomyces gamaensis]|uniref:DUF397 domain-containing protein n=1 Tax=Streptomyces gamaensis TaxID=1763542 RepID=A0ABW0Z519_9ACTN